MSNGAEQASGGATYRLLRELGSRAQHSYAAIREPHELVVAQRFVRVRSRADVDLARAENATPLDAEAMALLLRDARCLAKNWHPNIGRVRYVDLSTSSRTELVIASELIDGATLQELLDVAKPEQTDADEPLLALPVLVRILLDVLAGLHALHSLRDGINTALGAIHGELCPANVVVGRDGVARIVNVLRKRPVRIERGSEAVGYAAPEALDRHGTDDARSDVYAVGVMLWEGLAGRRLYDDDEPARLRSRQREAEPETPAVDPSSPLARLADVAMRALSFDPALRFRGAAEMAAELRKVAGTRLASGSAVATRVAELAGEGIRARRATLDPTSSGTRRRASDGAIRAAEVAVENRESPLERDPGAVVHVPSLPPLPPPILRPIPRRSSSSGRLLATPRRPAPTLTREVSEELIAASRPNEADPTDGIDLASDLLDEDDHDLPGPRASSPELDLHASLAMGTEGSLPPGPRASEPPFIPRISPLTPNVLLAAPPLSLDPPKLETSIAVPTTMTSTPGDVVIPLDVVEPQKDNAALRPRHRLLLVTLAGAMVLAATGAFFAVRPSKHSRARSAAQAAAMAAPAAAAPKGPPATSGEQPPVIAPLAAATPATSAVARNTSAAPVASTPVAVSATYRPVPRAPIPVKPKKSVYEPDGL